MHFDIYARRLETIVVYVLVFILKSISIRLVRELRMASCSQDLTQMLPQGG